MWNALLTSKQALVLVSNCNVDFLGNFPKKIANKTTLKPRDGLHYHLTL